MSKLKHYETMFILKPTLTEEETVAQLDGVKALFEKNGAEIVATENIGIKELAYEIEKCKRGYYYVIYFRAPANSIAEIERNYIYLVVQQLLKVQLLHLTNINLKQENKKKKFVF